MQMLPPTVAAFQILNEASSESQHILNSGAAFHAAGAVEVGKLRQACRSPRSRARPAVACSAGQRERLQVDQRVGVDLRRREQPSPAGKPRVPVTPLGISSADSGCLTSVTVFKFMAGASRHLQQQVPKKRDLQEVAKHQDDRHRPRHPARVPSGNSQAWKPRMASGISGHVVSPTLIALPMKVRTAGLSASTCGLRNRSSSMTTGNSVRRTRHAVFHMLGGLPVAGSFATHPGNDVSTRCAWNPATRSSLSFTIAARASDFSQRSRFGAE